MKMSLKADVFCGYVRRQIENFFPDLTPLLSLSKNIDRTLDRLEFCFSRSSQKYYSRDGGAYFDHLNSDQYAVFLYFLSREALLSGDIGLASKSYFLNKALNSIDIFYEVELPDIFTLRHPVGTVLGRAKYADYLCVYQNCLIGVDIRGRGPTFDGPVAMMPGSAVIGDCHVGADCWISQGTRITGQNLPPRSVVFNRMKQIEHKAARRAIVDAYFAPVRTSA